MRQPTKESFLKNIKDHQIGIIKDAGLYRHIRCKRPDTMNMYFDIITFLGGLLYTGDMGTYEFERVEDMFKFFRDPDKNLHINSDYYAEKCKAESIYGEGIRKFDEDSFINNIKHYYDTYFEDCDDSYKDEKERVWIEIESQILNNDHSEYELVSNLNNFSMYHDASEFQFTGFWEYSYQSKTYHFLWCLYAIVWTVQKYDEMKG